MSLLLNLLLLAAPQGDLASVPPQILPPPPQLVPPPRLLELDPDRIWKGHIDAGATLVSGNNESTTGSVAAAVERMWGVWSVGADAGYTGVRSTDQTTGDATTTSRLYTLGANGKRYFHEDKKLYTYVKGGDRRDEPSGLVERVDAGGGVGYRFDLYKDAFLGLEGGPSWVSEELVGVEETERTVVLRAAYNFEAPIAASLLSYGNGEYLTGGEVEALTTLTGLKWNFSDELHAFVSLQVNYDGSPAAGFESTDQILILGIGWLF